MKRAVRTFSFRGELLNLVEAAYANGNTAVGAFAADGQPYATLSVNMPGDPLPAGSFFVKDWSENADIAAAFISSGLVQLDQSIPPRTSGYIVASAYRFVAPLTPRPE